MSIVSRRTGKYRTPSFGEIVTGMKLLVKSREQIEQDCPKEGYSFVRQMEKLCGHTVTVDSVRDLYSRRLYPSDFKDPFNQPVRPYILVVDDEDGNPSEWFWTPEMFECILSNPMTIEYVNCI